MKYKTKMLLKDIWCLFREIYLSIDFSIVVSLLILFMLGSLSGVQFIVLLFFVIYLFFKFDRHYCLLREVYHDGKRNTKELEVLQEKVDRWENAAYFANLKREMDILNQNVNDLVHGKRRNDQSQGA